MSRVDGDYLWPGDGFESNFSLTSTEAREAHPVAHGVGCVLVALGFVILLCSPVIVWAVWSWLW